MLDGELKINQFLIQYSVLPNARGGHCRRADGRTAPARCESSRLDSRPPGVLSRPGQNSDRGREGAATSVDAALRPRLEALDGSQRLSFQGRITAGGRAGFRSVAAAATPEQLGRRTTNPYTKDALPTVQDGVAFLLTGHLGVHLGQLSSWRRMIELPPLF
jgi:hypothetical protein